LHQANIAYSGHTEILQDLANQYFPANTQHQSDMLFVHEQFRMLLLTRHVALQDVRQHLKPETVYQSLDSLIHFLRDQQGIPSPKLGILGVNPHAGEMQMQQEFCEERDIIAPVLEKLSKKHQISIDPPLAADAAFRGFNPKTPAYDCYVAAYHDQGLIPIKLVAGMQAVNVTIGLPFLRTSVSHGTAPDIAGKGIADASALKAAFDLADQLTN
jgi:4-hydroxythreonine-4-phosphate dehydrogenase